MKPFDPFAENAFRKRGLTRDLKPIATIKLPGLKWSDPVPDVKGDFTASDLDRATWFEASGPEDATALQLLARGDPSVGEVIWRERAHNRSILEHLSLFQNDSDKRLWGQVFANWCNLAKSDPSYREVAEQLQSQLESRAREALADGRPEPVRWSLEVLSAGFTGRGLDDFQSHLCVDDFDRFSLACANVRQSLLESKVSANVESSTRLLETQVLPQAVFLNQALLTDSSVVNEVGRQMALLWRAVARSWADLGNQLSSSSGVVAGDAGLQAMEEAFRWAPAELKAELEPELEHLRWRGRALESRQASSEVLKPRRSLSAPAVVGTAVCVLIGVLLYSTDLTGYSWFRSWRYPKVAVNREIQSTLSQIQPLVQDIAKLDHALEGQSQSQAPEQWHRRERLRRRHERLVKQLERLEAIRRMEIDSGPKH